jgi:hypothetical protein
MPKATIRFMSVCPTFPPETPPVYEIKRKIKAEPERSQMTIRRMRFECWILRLQTHTQNTKYLSLFHSQNGYGNVSQCYVYLYIACLVLFIYYIQLQHQTTRNLNVFVLMVLIFSILGPDIPGFLLQPFRKPKRIRTAFSPSQLLKLEHAFEKNHYVVGAERKQLAQSLSLTETQVTTVWPVYNPRGLQHTTGIALLQTLCTVYMLGINYSN